MSFSYTAPESGGRPWPKWFGPVMRGYVLPTMIQTAQQYNTSGAAGADQLRSAAAGELTKSLSGAYLTSDRNPYLAENEEAIRRAAQEQLDRSLAGINAAAAQGGTLFSTKTAQVSADAARRSAGDVAATIAGLRNQDYGRERNAMVQATQGAARLSSMPLEDLLALISAFKGNFGGSRGASYAGSYNGPYGPGGEP